MLSWKNLLTKIGSILQDIIKFLKILLRFCFNRWFKVDFQMGKNMKNKGSDEPLLIMGSKELNENEIHERG